MGLRMKITITLEAPSEERLDVMRDMIFEEIQRGVGSSEAYWAWKPGYSKFEVKTEEMD